MTTIRPNGAAGLAGSHPGVWLQSLDKTKTFPVGKNPDRLEPFALEGADCFTRGEVVVVDRMAAKDPAESAAWFRLNHERAAADPQDAMRLFEASHACVRGHAGDEPVH